MTRQQRPPSPMKKTMTKLWDSVDTAYAAAALSFYRKERARCRIEFNRSVWDFRKLFLRRANRIMPILVYGKAWDAPLEPGPHPLELHVDSDERHIITSLRWRVSGVYKNQSGCGRTWKWHWAENWPIDRVPSRLRLKSGGIIGSDADAYILRFTHLTALNTYYVELRRHMLAVLTNLHDLRTLRPLDALHSVAAQAGIASAVAGWTGSAPSLPLTHPQAVVPVAATLAPLRHDYPAPALKRDSSCIHDLAAGGSTKGRFLTRKNILKGNE